MGDQFFCSVPCRYVLFCSIQSVLFKTTKGGEGRKAWPAGGSSLDTILCHMQSHVGVVWLDNEKKEMNAIH